MKLLWNVLDIYETVPVPIDKVVKVQKERVGYQLVLYTRV